MQKAAPVSIGVFIAIFIGVYVAVFANKDDKENNTSIHTGSTSIISGSNSTSSLQGAGVSNATNEIIDNDANWEVVANRLDAPWSMIMGDDNHIIVTERGGNIVEIDITNGNKRTIKTLPAEQSKGTAEAGLLGITKDNSHIYVAYSYRMNGQYMNRLVKMSLENGELGEEQILINNAPGSNNHDGGALKIGPDGKIYWTLGDAGDDDAAQNTKVLNGKILRVNTDGSVPSDNPMKDSYIRSYGHRNPQGLAWQPGTNQLRSTEHGPSSSRDCCRDEINIINEGNNYGWPIIRGDQTQSGMITPVRISGNEDTWAPSGISFVTAGAWDGNLLIAGLRGEALYRVILNDTKIESVERYLYKKFGRIRDVMTTDDGYIYILTNNTDGRGGPRENDDKLLRIKVQ